MKRSDWTVIASNPHAEFCCYCERIVKAGDGYLLKSSSGGTRKFKVAHPRCRDMYAKRKRP